MPGNLCPPTSHTWGTDVTETNRPDNPVVHDYPGHALPPSQMHDIINSPIHANCTFETCDMLRACWTWLIDLGHPHPSDPPDQCPNCSTGDA